MRALLLCCALAAAACSSRPQRAACAATERTLCGGAKARGAQPCMSCAADHAVELVAAGCADAAIRSFCGAEPPAPPLPPPAPPGAHPPPLHQQTLGHMQLMLGYSAAPEYVRGFANVIMSGVNGYNATAPSGAVTNVWEARVEPEVLLTVWGLRSFVSMPNVFDAVRSDAPGWRETIASWGRVVRPLAERGVVVGVFVGDESCSGFSCPYSNISAIVDAVRAAVGGGSGRPPWIYDNEAGPWNPDSWGLARWPRIPPNLDLISFDWYVPDAGVQEVTVCRQKYERYLYPLLGPAQRVMLVPYTAGCDPSVCLAAECADPTLCPSPGQMDCPMELQAANNVRRLRGYMDWALNDSRIAGFHPWHI